MRALIFEGRGGGWDRDMLRSALHLGWSGADISFVQSVEEGLLHASHLQHELLVIHVSSVAQDWLLCVREARAHCDAVIVAVSDSYKEFELIEAIEAGADDYMALPLNLPVFIARVRAALRRVRVPLSADASASYGDLEIDPGRHEARVDGRDLSLTSTEFRLLLELAKRGDLVARKVTLCQTLWGQDGGSEGAILRKYIQSLRRKLSAPPANAAVSILTVPGVGYKLVPTAFEPAPATRS